MEIFFNSTDIRTHTTVHVNAGTAGYRVFFVASGLPRIFDHRLSNYESEGTELVRILIKWSSWHSCHFIFSLLGLHVRANKHVVFSSGLNVQSWQMAFLSSLRRIQVVRVNPRNPVYLLKHQEILLKGWLGGILMDIRMVSFFSTRLELPWNTF